MDIFKPFLGQGKVSVIYRDGTVAEVEISPTPPGSYYEVTFPYTIIPSHNIKFGLNGCLYAYDGKCYLGGDADIVSIQPVNDVEQNMSYNYKAVLIGLAEILVAASPDDDQGDVVEEIREHMNTYFKEIMD